MITQPEHTPVDETLQRSKNAVTMNYAEAQRLKELSNALEYKIVEQNKEIVTNNNLLADAELKIKNNNTKILELNNSVDAYLLKISDLKKQDADLTAQIKVKTDEFQERESILVSNETQFQEALERLNKKDSDLLKREEVIEQREHKLKQFVQSL